MIQVRMVTQRDAIREAASEIDTNFQLAINRALREIDDACDDVVGIEYITNSDGTLQKVIIEYETD